MSLQKTQKKMLFAPQAETQAGTLPVSVEGLENAGFDACVIRGRPCVHAVAILPHLDSGATMLCCAGHSKVVSAEEASVCTRRLTNLEK